MRQNDRFTTAALTLLVVAGLSVLLCYWEGGSESAIRWSIISAGFAIGGGLCYIASAIAGVARSLRQAPTKNTFDKAEA